VVPGGKFASGSEPWSTNQRMEITAVVQALTEIEGPLQVTSDSTYVVNCFRQRWWEGWVRRGWRNAKGSPVANRDLWEPLIASVNERGAGEVEFRWVKAHADDGFNALADRLANTAARLQAGESGSDPAP
ncbi:MAG: ribonuclease H family protein, partial [Acidimicrobiales bacterium]